MVGTKKYYYKPILPRPWWGAQARLTASIIDKCMTDEHNYDVHKLDLRILYKSDIRHFMKCQGYRDNIMPGLLDWDKVHLNENGYRILTKKLLSSLCQYRYGKPYGPGSGAALLPKKKRHPKNK